MNNKTKQKKKKGKTEVDSGKTRFKYSNGLGIVGLIVGFIFVYLCISLTPVISKQTTEVIANSATSITLGLIALFLALIGISIATAVGYNTLKKINIL